jgi:prolyl oligopeptidase
VPRSVNDRAAAGPPEAPVRPVVDTYHDVDVRDPYRWLEEGVDPAIPAWIAAQNTHTRRVLDGWPAREALRRRVTELTVTGSVAYGSIQAAGGRLFAIKRQPPLEQTMLVTFADADDPEAERVIVDPNKLDPSGRTSIDWFVPSFDGGKVAVSLSFAGTESGDVHVFDVWAGARVGAVVPRVNGGTAGGSLAWSADGGGFWYTRYPRPGERPEGELGFDVHVYWHAIGSDPASDRYEIGRELPSIAEIRLESSSRGAAVLASVQRGDGGEFTHWLRDAAGLWRALTRYEDRCVAARLSNDGAIYFVSLEGAPKGRVLRLSIAEAAAGIRRAETIVPEMDDAIECSFAYGTGLWAEGDRIYVLYQQGGPNVVRAFTPRGAPSGELPQTPMSAVDDLVILPGGDVLFQVQSLTTPPAWYRRARQGGPAVRTALAETSPADFGDCEVVREEAVSNDGTRVPITVLRRKGIALDGKQPVLITGYGGYGVCQSPAFRGRMRAWIERGGVFAVAHLRGGGEFGECWHREGCLARKQNVFDDFAACARRMIDAGYCTSEKLALMGGSNGGLLMGAMITQHPTLARAVVSLVGLYDMLRVELTPNGAYNVPEFGSVTDPAMFRALYAYSPYHRVKDGTAYPSILMTAGENDPRVDAWQSWKMVARLQAATSSPHPILLRTNAAAGHGKSTPLSEQVEETTDVFAFLMRELGVAGPTA